VLRSQAFGKIESHSRELVDFLTVSTIRALATVFGLPRTTVVRACVTSLGLTATES